MRPPRARQIARGSWPGRDTCFGCGGCQDRAGARVPPGSAAAAYHLVRAVPGSARHRRTPRSRQQGQNRVGQGDAAQPTAQRRTTAGCTPFQRDRALDQRTNRRIPQALLRSIRPVASAVIPRACAAGEFRRIRVLDLLRGERNQAAAMNRYLVFWWRPMSCTKSNPGSRIAGR